MTPTIDTSPEGLERLANDLLAVCMNPATPTVVHDAQATLRALADEKERGAPSLSTTPPPTVARTEEARRAVLTLARNLVAAGEFDADLAHTDPAIAGCVRRIIENRTDWPDAPVRDDDALYDDLSIDDVGTSHVAADIALMFGIVAPAADRERWYSVGDVVRYVEAKVAP